MVPTAHSTDMARRIPGAQLVIYEDAGIQHGGIFCPVLPQRLTLRPNFQLEKTP
jgi:hypothetical protein